MKLTLIMGAISLVVSLSTNLFMSTSRRDWLESSTLGSHSEITGFSAWLHTSMAVIFSGFAFWTIFEMREEARNLYRAT